MASKEERARSLLSQVMAIINAEQYFDPEPERPVIDGMDGNYTITLVVHIGVHNAESLLKKGPHWAASPKHPYIKVKQVWLGGTLSNYIYQLVDSSFSYKEGFHLHPESNSGRKGLYHHVIEVSRKRTWNQLQAETPLRSALMAFVASIWRLRS